MKYVAKLSLVISALAIILTTTVGMNSIAADDADIADINGIEIIHEQ